MRRVKLDHRGRQPEGASDHRRLSAEERARDLIRRGLPLPLAGHLCEPESCAVPDLERCPWPFWFVWMRDLWGGWAPISGARRYAQRYAQRSGIAGMCWSTERRDAWPAPRACYSVPHTYSLEHMHLLDEIKELQDQRRAEEKNNGRADD